MLKTPLLKAHADRAHALVVAADVLLVGLGFYLALSLPDMYQPSHGTGEIGALRLALVSLVVSLSWPLTLQELGLYQSQRRRSRRQIPLWLLPAATASLQLPMETAQGGCQSSLHPAGHECFTHKLLI